jgi:hypothetical protein
MSGLTPALLHPAVTQTPTKSEVHRNKCSRISPKANLLQAWECEWEYEGMYKHFRDLHKVLFVLVPRICPRRVPFRTVPVLTPRVPQKFEFFPEINPNDGTFLIRNRKHCQSALHSVKYDKTTSIDKAPPPTLWSEH